MGHSSPLKKVILLKLSSIELSNSFQQVSETLLCKCEKIMVIFYQGIFLSSWQPCKHLKSYINEMHVFCHARIRKYPYARVCLSFSSQQRSGVGVHLTPPWVKVWVKSTLGWRRLKSVQMIHLFGSNFITALFKSKNKRRKSRLYCRLAI